MPTSWWYADERTHECQTALAVCAECGVRDECLADAAAVESDPSLIVGVRGGLTATARRAGQHRSLRARLLDVDGAELTAQTSSAALSIRETSA
jgi:hypothetical protein